MIDKVQIINGEKYLNGKKCLDNAFLVYKDRDVIIDYEHNLHGYMDGEIPEGTVPVEIYPYANDIRVVFAKYSSIEGWTNRVDLDSLYEVLKKALDEEEDYACYWEEVYPGSIYGPCYVDDDDD